MSIWSEFIKDNPIRNSFSTALEDLSDMFGIGSARRNREYEAEQAVQQYGQQMNAMQQQHDYNMQEIDHAYQLQLDARKTQYKDAVEGLQSAGLNPVMGISGAGVPSASAVGVSGASGSKGNGSSAGVGMILGAMSSMMNSASRIAKYS